MLRYFLLIFFFGWWTVNAKQPTPLPQPNDIEKIEHTSGPQIFSTESLILAISRLKPGSDRKIGEDRAWQTGKIILKNKTEIPFRTDSSHRLQIGNTEYLVIQPN